MPLQIFCTQLILLVARPAMKHTCQSGLPCRHYFLAVLLFASGAHEHSFECQLAPGRAPYVILLQLVCNFLQRCQDLEHLCISHLGNIYTPLWNQELAHLAVQSADAFQTQTQVFCGCSPYQCTAQRTRTSGCDPSSTRPTTCTAKPSSGDHWSRPTQASSQSNHWPRIKRYSTHPTVPLSSSADPMHAFWAAEMDAHFHYGRRSTGNRSPSTGPQEWHKFCSCLKHAVTPLQ